MEVRSLRWSDFEGWADLQSSRYAELESNPELGLYTEPVPPSTADLANYFAGIMVGLLEHRIISTIATEGDLVLGHASIYPVGDHREKRHIGSLGMAVRPGYRGRGIGDRLLATTLEASIGAYEIVELSVTSTNEPALRLYRKHGFVERGRLPRSFKRGELYLDEILMSRPVPSPVGGPDHSAGPRAGEHPP